MATLALVQRASGLITMTVIARVLDNRGLGAYAFTHSTSQTFYGLARLGADAGMHVGLAGLDLQRDRQRAQELLGESFSVFLAIAALVSLSVVALADPIAASLFGAPDLTPYVYAAAALFAAQTMNQYAYTAFAGLNAFAAYSRVTMIGTAMTIVIVISASLTGGAIAAAWGLVAAQAASGAVASIGLARVFKTCGLAFRPLWPSGSAWSILRLGFPFYAGGLFLVPADFANLAHLSRSVGVEMLGDLRVTQALISVAAALPTAIAGPTLTFLTERHARGEGAAGLMLQFKAIWVLAVVAAVPLMVIWPFAIDIAFGPGFEAARTVGVLALTGFLSSMLLTVFQGGLLARRNSRSLFWIGSVNAGALIALGSWMIGPFGLAGYLLSQAIAATLACAISYRLLVGGNDGLTPSAWMGWLAMVTITIYLQCALTMTGKHDSASGLLTTAVLAAVSVVVLLTKVLSLGERQALWQAARQLLRPAS